MCGIAGYITNNISEKFDIEKALNELKHRGPNNNQYVTIENQNILIVFGHTRLSIIDLTNSADQPMFDFKNNFLLTFNGEIYNYLEIRNELIDLGYNFNTNSDTEVLLNAWIHWGKNCLNKFTGMFAFVIYSKIENKIFFVRDGFGIKPLYYYFDKKTIYFASEITPIFLLSKKRQEADWNTAYRYLVNSEYDNNEHTFFKDILQLEPATLLEFNLVDFTIKKQKWWNPSIELNEKITFDEAVIKLRNIFLNNVNLHLRSDVPIAFALSGGVDSSALVCAAAINKNLEVSTFSYIDSKKEFDESKWVDLVNNQIHAKDHKFLLNKNDLNNEIVNLIKKQGEPFTSTSVYAQYKVFEHIKKNGFIVSLDGQGADELFAGYNGFPGKRFRSLYYEKGILNSLNFLINWSKNPSHKLFYGLISSLSEFLPDRYKNIFLKIIGRNQCPKYLNLKLIDTKIVTKENESYDNKRSLMYELKRNLLGKGLGAYLRHADRNSMAWSIESRVPFLTKDLAEFTLSLPESFFISKNGETKFIFKKALNGIVPNEILNRSDKVGFRTNEEDFLKFNEKLYSSCIEVAKNIPLFNSSIKYSLEKFSKKGDGWKLINYCIWYKIFIEKENFKI